MANCILKPIGLGTTHEHMLILVDIGQRIARSKMGLIEKLASQIFT